MVICLLQHSLKIILMFYIFISYEFPIVTTGTADFFEIHDNNQLNARNVKHFSHPLLQSLNKYQIIIPQQYADYHHKIVKRHLHTHHENKTGIHFKQLYFSFDYQDHKFILDLSLNHRLLPQTFSVASFDKNGKLLLQKPLQHELDHCYYQGTVRGIYTSQVVLSTCHGLRGYISLPDDFLVIEPLNDDPYASTGSEHVLYRITDVKKKDSMKTCGNHHSIANMNEMIKKINKFSDTMQSSHRHRRAVPETQFVELVMVADYKETRAFPDRIQLDNRIKGIVNMVDGFYQKINVRVVLSHIEVWNHTNFLSNSTKAQEVLDEFLSFRLKRKRDNAHNSKSPWVHADNFHLLFGGNFDGSTVGMATVETMCGSRSGGVNQDGGGSILSRAAILAHEMGHNFGMEHDTRDCACADQSDCIMAASLGGRPMKAWSNCSAAYLEENLRLGVGSCLSNRPDPSTIYGGPECGNEILEEGEECDCGTSETCPSHRERCCHPQTCTLQPTARCAEGHCCDNCQYRETGFVCRAADSECGLSEYCTGTSPYCPVNVYKLNGSPCRGSSMCFDGICLTRDLQCLSVWGSGTTSGIDSCYKLINEFGNANGNCGINNERKYINCTEENAKCGKLVCQGGGTRPVIGRDRTKFLTSVSVNDGKDVVVCKTIASAVTDNDVTDIGLVRRGTSCGEGKYCDNGECKSLQSSSLTCHEKCNERGVCNNLYNCHCNEGWAPPSCLKSGNGGSVNSGPINASQDLQAILLIVFIAVLLPIVLVAFTLLWYHRCRGKEEVQKWKDSRKLRLQAVAISKGKVPKASEDVSSSSDNLVGETPTVTFTSSANSQSKYLVTTTSQNGGKALLTTPKRPPPPSKSPARPPPPMKPHYAPIINKPTPTRKAPPPPGATKIVTTGAATSTGQNSNLLKKSQPPPRPALPPNAWADAEEP